MIKYKSNSRGSLFWLTVKGTANHGEEVKAGGSLKHLEASGEIMCLELTIFWSLPSRGLTSQTSLAQSKWKLMSAPNSFFLWLLYHK